MVAMVVGVGVAMVVAVGVAIVVAMVVGVGVAMVVGVGVAIVVGVAAAIVVGVGVAMFVVFDLDGTLALNAHRQHFLQQEPKDWDGWHAACMGDLPNPPVVAALLAHYNIGHRIEVWSARSDVSEALTRRWLRFYVRTTGGAPVAEEGLARMRRAGDHRPDVVLKREWLMEARANGGAPDLVYDDRDCVVAMWRGEGIPCFQVAPGAF